MSQRVLTPLPGLRWPLTPQPNVASPLWDSAVASLIFSPRREQFNKTPVLFLAGSWSRAYKQRAKYTVLWRSGGPFFAMINCVNLLLWRKRLTLQSLSVRVPESAFTVWPSSWQSQTRRNEQTSTIVEKLNQKWNATERFFLLVTSAAGYWWIGLPGFQ